MERADPDEIAALRGGAALSPLDDRALLVARGEDRTSFLQGMLANDVARLEPGAGTYALLLSEQGRTVSDVCVLAVDDALLLELPRASRARVREALERYVVADDVELLDDGSFGLAVRGPRAAAALGQALGTDAASLAGLPECGHVALEHETATHRVARIRDYGLDGFHAWSASAQARDALAGALETAGARRAGEPALEALRIAAGWPREDVDYGPQTLAAELPPLARSVSYRKGCYLGQEVMERVAARGHVNWLLVRLTADDGSSLSPGDQVRDGDAEVGRVTSVAPPSGDSVTHALARVRAAVAEPGRRVVVGAAGREVPVHVTTIPVAGGGDGTKKEREER